MSINAPNFIYNTITDIMHDSSGNQRTQIMNMLDGLITENMLSHNNGLNRILTQSLMEKTPYKKILSKLHSNCRGRDKES